MGVGQKQPRVSQVPGQRCSLDVSESRMKESIQLSLEQQFSLRSFETQVQQMSREQAQEFLVKLYQQMMMKETLYQHFLRQQWGIGPSPDALMPEFGS